MSDTPKTPEAIATSGGRGHIDKVINEMFESEESYMITLLHFLNYERTLKDTEKDKKRKKIWSDEDKKALQNFTLNAQSIVTAQKIFFAVKADIDANRKTITQSIPTIIALLKGEFGYYEGIANEFSKLGSLNYDIEIPNSANIKSNSVFILPIQRLPRWVLLIKEVLKKHRENGGLLEEEVIAFEDFQDKAEAVAKHLNESMKKYENYIANFEAFSKDTAKAREIIKNTDDLSTIQEFITPDFINRFNHANLIISFGALSENITPEQAAKKLSDCIGFGFNIGFETDPTKEAWLKKIGNTPIIISGPLAPPDAVKRAINNGLLLTDNNFKVQVSTDFFTACEAQSKTFFSDQTAVSFIRAITIKGERGANILTKDAIAKIRKTEAKRIAEHMPPSPTKPLSSSEVKVAAEIAHSEQQAPLKQHGDIFKQIQEADQSPKKAKLIATVDKLKEEIMQGKLWDRTPENLAKTVSKLLSKYPKGLTVTLGAPDSKMTGEQAAQLFSDYISCGFEINFNPESAIDQWRKLINPNTSKVFPIGVNEFQGLSDDLLLMNRAASQLNSLFENGFKVFHVSKSYYEKLQEIALRDKEQKGEVAKLIESPMFVIAEKQQENELKRAVDEVTPPPKVRRGSAVTQERPSQTSSAMRQQSPSEAVAVAEVVPVPSTEKQLLLEPKKRVLRPSTTQMKLENQPSVLFSKNASTNLSASVEPPSFNEKIMTWQNELQIYEDLIKPQENSFLNTIGFGKFEARNGQRKALVKALNGLVLAKTQPEYDSAISLIKGVQSDIEKFRLPGKKSRLQTIVEKMIIDLDLVDAVKKAKRPK